MATKKITFDPEAGVAYPCDLIMNVGADFSATFNVVDTSNTGFNFSTTNSVGVGTTTGWTGSSQMTKSTAIGSTAFPTIKLHLQLVLIQLASSGYGLTISLGSTDTRSVKAGRYVYDILVGSGATVYRIVDGNIQVRGGVSSDIFTPKYG